jgi:hypothetical protein
MRIRVTVPVTSAMGSGALAPVRRRGFAGRGRSTLRRAISAAQVVQRAITGHHIAVDGDFVPMIGVTDIVDRDIVMLAPEEWHGVEYLSLTPGNAPNRASRAA